MRFHILCAFYVLFMLGGCSSTLSQISNEHGFQRFQGPPKILQPGTLIVLEDSGETLTTLTPVCWQHQAFPTLRPAKAVSEAGAGLMRELGDWLDLEPEYLTPIQAKFPEVENIQLRLRNASVVEYSDTDLYKEIPNRSQSCLNAVAEREANGETVYTILKALKTDVTYKVMGVNRSRMLGKLPQKTLERLKTELGGSSISTFSQTISGATHQVAFQPDIIGIDNFPPAEVDSQATLEANALISAESGSASPQESEVMPSKEPRMSTEDAEISNTQLGEVPRRSRLTASQRQLIIQKMAVLSRETSDADRLQ